MVIPTRNRAGLLEDCLRSLCAQTLPAAEFEVLVVDNGSTDQTAEVTARFSGPLQLRYVYEPKPGLHAGRHAGARSADSDILIFGDDDIVAHPTWVASVVDAFSDDRVALVGGNNLPLFEQTPPAWLQRWWQRRHRHGKALAALSIIDFGEGIFPIDPGHVWGCNFSIRRQALMDAGGFHPDAMPADRLRWRGDGETHVSDEIRRSGRKALFHSGASVGHRVASERMTERYFVQRSHAQGISDSYTDLRQVRAHHQRSVPLRRRIAASLATVKAVAGSLGDAAGRELASIRRRCAAAYLAGYTFHQREVARDPELRAWVLKENYFS